MKTFLDFLLTVVRRDCTALEKAQKSYGDSWKRRGGVGAFMMLARKWDRLENFLAQLPERAKSLPGGADKYDIFRAVQIDARAEGVIDDIRDLRRYLILVEAELMVQGTVPEEVTKDEPENPLPGDVTVALGLRGFRDVRGALAGALARGYTHPKNSRKVLDSDLINAQTEEVMMLFTQPLARNVADGGSQHANG